MRGGKFVVTANGTDEVVFLILGWNTWWRGGLYCTQLPTNPHHEIWGRANFFNLHCYEYLTLTSWGPTVFPWWSDHDPATKRKTSTVETWTIPPELGKYWTCRVTLIQQYEPFSPSVWLVLSNILSFFPTFFCFYQIFCCFDPTFYFFSSTFWCFSI